MINHIRDKIEKYEGRKLSCTIFTADEISYIYQVTSSFNSLPSKSRDFNKRLSAMYHGISEKLCKQCGKILEFKDFKTYPFQQYCSRKCKHDDPDSIKQALTKLKTNKKEISEKRKATCRRRYGVSNPMQVDRIKNLNVENRKNIESSIQKRKQTNILKYGHSNYLQSEEVKARRLQKILDRKFDDLVNFSTITPLFSREEYHGILNTGITNKYPFKCIQCNHEFKQHVASWTEHDKCPKCNSSINKFEEIISNILDEFNVDYITHDRNILSGKELDYYLPEHKLAIEIDGLYYHSTRFNSNRSYHLEKTEQCADQDIQLIHIFGDEIMTSPNIIKDRIRMHISRPDNVIYARKCTLKLISSSDKKEFLEKYHIQGNIPSSINIGLFFNDIMVSVMTFGKHRSSLGSMHVSGKYELYRYCTVENTRVVGGMSKMLKYFINEYNPVEITSYCCRRWSTLDNGYSKIGFQLHHVSGPNYWIVKGNNRYHRYKYRKSELSKLLESYDSNKSESDNLEANGLYKIWDCGSFVYKWTCKDISN